MYMKKFSDGLNKGFYYMMQELPRERAGGCLEALAHLEYAFEATRKYTMVTVKNKKAVCRI